MSDHATDNTSRRKSASAADPIARRAEVLVEGDPAGVLEELADGTYSFRYNPDYEGASVSLTMPTDQRVWRFNRFPPFFEGLLPEGEMLEGLLRQHKIDSNDLFSQLLAVGADLVGAITVREAD
ncbi:MAG: toxin HipA [Candidatus Aegiribacteria sp.]|nr:toxin HipA [Candidatus Aegiribacteria sp.]MBD3295334.1 toxin HipA [Candidatus Fermentibacteria bacterium]